MSSLKKAILTSLGVGAMCATLFAGAAPAQAHDGRNAALIGGLIAGAVIGGALSQAQAYDDGPAYSPGYHRYPAHAGYYIAGPRYRYRDDCDHEPGNGAYYRNDQDWD
jgi:hypothetical protein